MARYDNRHSRVVAWLKVALPLAALALLSTVFLLARKPSGDGAIPYARGDVDQLAAEQALTGPSFQSVMTDGTAIQIKAARAVPDVQDASKIRAEALEARVDRPGGTVLLLRAPVADLDTAHGRAALSNGVEITSEDGLRVEALTVDSALDATDLAARTITARYGDARLSADQMRVTEGTDGPLVVFSGGVQLILPPRPDPEAP